MPAVMIGIIIFAALIIWIISANSFEKVGDITNSKVLKPFHSEAQDKNNLEGDKEE